MPPWELAKQPIYWREVALIIESAEINARNEQQKRAAAANLGVPKA